MFTNIIFRPFLVYLLFSIILGALLSYGLSMFLPKKEYKIEDSFFEKKDKTFKVSKILNIVEKRHIVKKKVIHTSREYVLKDFSLSGIILDGDDSLVIVKSSKGGIFLYKNNSYKGYKLIEVYQNKARFKKGIDYYWAFLSAEEEKAFRSSSSSQVSGNGSNSTQVETFARKMFNDIKFKNGKYFVPQDILSDRRQIQKSMSQIWVQSYNMNGKISFVFKRINPSSVYAKLGLKVNDKVIKINSKEIKSVTQPLKMFQNLDKIKQLSLTVKRGSEIKELKYEVY